VPSSRAAARAAGSKVGWLLTEAVLLWELPLLLVPLVLLLWLPVGLPL